MRKMVNFYVRTAKKIKIFAKNVKVQTRKVLTIVKPYASMGSLSTDAIRVEGVGYVSMESGKR